MEVYGYRNKKIFYSDIPGTLIINAITGEIYPYKVGSPDEKKLFKVRDNSLLNKFNTEYQNGHTAYYKDINEYLKFNNIYFEDKESFEIWKESITK